MQPCLARARHELRLYFGQSPCHTKFESIEDSWIVLEIRVLENAPLHKECSFSQVLVLDYWSSHRSSLTDLRLTFDLHRHVESHWLICLHWWTVRPKTHSTAQYLAVRVPASVANWWFMGLYYSLQISIPLFESIFSSGPGLFQHEQSLLIQESVLFPLLVS